MGDSVPKQIGIAVVEHADHYLIGTRGPDGPLPGYAEFPGGKCFPDEAPEACTLRECQEETGLTVTIERLLLRREFVYPHAIVDLHFFLCHPTDSSDVAADHNGFHWVPAYELPSLKLPEANAPIVELLVR